VRIIKGNSREKVVSWKRIQSKRIGKRRRVLARGLGLGLGLGLAFLVGGWVWFQRGGGYWNGMNRLSLLMQREEGGWVLVSVDTVKKQVALVGIDGEMYMRVRGGYGDYRVAAVKKLGELEEKGWRLLGESVETWLGTVVYGVVEGVSVSENSSLTKVGWEWIRGRYEGDLQVWERWMVGAKLFESWGWEVERVNVAEEYGEVVEAIGEEEKVMMEERWLEEIGRKYLQDWQIKQESGVSVAVLNATDRSGLATETAKLLGRMGYDVVMVSEVEAEKETHLYGGSEVRKKESYLWPMEKVLKVVVEEKSEAMGLQRADVVLVVGDDWGNWLLGE